MTPLQDVIYTYAQENLLRRLLREDNAALHRSERETEELIGQLKALGGEPERLVKKLRFASDTAASLREQGCFLAGLAAGMELGSFSAAARTGTTCWHR